jgi:hypothetical protein
MNPERFWSRFALEQHTVEGASVLENRNLPFLEVNAAYPTSSHQIPALEAWFAARGRSGVLILPEESTLEFAVSNAGFESHSSVSVLEIVGDVRLEPQVWVEQVPWSLGRAVGEIIAVAHGANAWAELISTEVARVMQGGSSLESDSSVTAYLAYHGEEPVGALLRIGDSSYLSGVMNAGSKVNAARALTNRAALDAGGKLEFGVQDRDLEHFADSRILGGFFAWVKR